MENSSTSGAIAMREIYESRWPPTHHPCGEPTESWRILDPVCRDNRREHRRTYWAKLAICGLSMLAIALLAVGYALQGVMLP